MLFYVELFTIVVSTAMLCFYQQFLPEFRLDELTKQDRLFLFDELLTQ